MSASQKPVFTASVTMNVAQPGSPSLAKKSTSTTSTASPSLTKKNNGDSPGVVKKFNSLTMNATSSASASLTKKMDGSNSATSSSLTKKNAPASPSLKLKATSIASPSLTKKIDSSPSLLKKQDSITSSPTVVASPSALSSPSMSKKQFDSPDGPRRIQSPLLAKKFISPPSSPVLNPGSPGYGSPVPGSLTEKRARQAHTRISQEIVELCSVIQREGIRNEKEGTATILFGRLFDIYVYISNKLVGVLLRARRHKLVSFEGETLFQRQDDHVPVTLLRPLEEIRSKMMEEQQQKEFEWGKCVT